MTPTPRWPGSSTIGDPPPNHDPVRPSEMTPRTEAGTKAGQRLLAGMPWMTKRERESWLRLILAIEAEAAAAERERLRGALPTVLVTVTRDLVTEHRTDLRGDGWPAYTEFHDGKETAVTLLVRDYAEALADALLAVPDEAGAGE